MHENQEPCSALLKQINDALQKQGNNMLRSAGLTLSQIRLLQVLQQEKEASASYKELEHRFGVSQPTMAGIISRLEQKKLVETFGSPDDKRIKLVRLTKAGEEKCELGYSFMNMAEEHLLCGLDEKERAEFLRLLKKIKQAI